MDKGLRVQYNTVINLDLPLFTLKYNSVSKFYWVSDKEGFLQENCHPLEIIHYFLYFAGEHKFGFYNTLVYIY